MGDDATGGGRASLRRVITLRYAVAMYVTSVLGAGVLVVPGLAARIAGPGSLFAWIFLALASYPFAYTFSRLSARSPQSGGIYAFTREAFGIRAATVVAWLFIAWVVFGAPAISLSAAAYLAYSLPMSRPETFVVAALILIAGFAVNVGGIRMSGRIQLAIVLVVVAVLLLAVGASAGSIRSSNFTPVFPEGIAAVGTASALIVWSFLGYENVSNVAEEFKDPRRDFGRSVTTSVVLIGSLYLLVAIAVIGTGAYSAGSGLTPFAVMMSRVFGAYGGAALSVLAVVVIFGTVNAYTGGLARLFYASARDGGLPKFLGTIDPGSGAPRPALIALISVNMLSLLSFYLLQVGVQSGFLATSGAAVMTYIIGSAAGVKLLGRRGRPGILPVLSLAASFVLLPFVGLLLVPSIVVLLVALAYSWLRFGEGGIRGRTHRKT
jgi:amino acid efflux transporter